MLWSASAGLHIQIDQTVSQLKARFPEIMTTTDSFWLATRERALDDMVKDLTKTENALTAAKRAFLVTWKRPTVDDTVLQAITKDQFAALPPACAPGQQTMQWAIGALVLRAEQGSLAAGHKLASFEPVFEDARTQFFSRLPDDGRQQVEDRLDAYEEARRTAVSACVPEVLADVAKYSAALRLALRAANRIKHRSPSGASPTERLRGLAADSKSQTFMVNGERLPVTADNVAKATADPNAPDASTLARTIYDRRTGAKLSINLYNKVTRVISRLKCKATCNPGPPKETRRFIYKSVGSYGGDTTKCRDKARCTIETGGVAACADVGDALIESDDIICVRWKDRFDPEYDALPIGGYRDLQLQALIEMNGRYHYVEIQVNITPMLHIKAGVSGGGQFAAAKLQPEVGTV